LPALRETEGERVKEAEYAEEIIGRFGGMAAFEGRVLAFLAERGPAPKSLIARRVFSVDLVCVRDAVLSSLAARGLVRSWRGGRATIWGLS
jgi:hypothetical protein